MANNNSPLAIIESATTLPSDLKKELTEFVVSLVGKDVAVTFKVTSGLLGGFSIQIGDRKIDASLSSELKQLAQSLKG